MREKVIKPKQDAEFYTDERCYILESSNSPDDEGLSIARARVKPGVSTCWHRLRESAERYYILSGTGRVEVGQLTPEDVKAGDVVLIPPGCRQRITNTGTSDLVFWQSAPLASNLKTMKTWNPENAPACKNRRCAKRPPVLVNCL